MKKILPVFVIASLAACSNNGGANIPGVYVNTQPGNSEFSTIVGDTVYLKKTGNETSFLITRNVTYRQIVNGRHLSAKQTSETELGTYDKNDRRLFTVKTGSTLSFDFANRVMIYNSASYKKIH